MRSHAFKGDIAGQDDLLAVASRHIRPPRNMVVS
jgi:hypothetical protein